MGARYSKTAAAAAADAAEVEAEAEGVEAAAKAKAVDPKEACITWLGQHVAELAANEGLVEGGN